MSRTDIILWINNKAHSGSECHVVNWEQDNQNDVQLPRQFYIYIYMQMFNSWSQDYLPLTLFTRLFHDSVKRPESHTNAKLAYYRCPTTSITTNVPNWFDYIMMDWIDHGECEMVRNQTRTIKYNFHYNRTAPSLEHITRQRFETFVRPITSSGSLVNFWELLLDSMEISSLNPIPHN